jgi:tetratricopeptide (TPR) repeat protein
VLAAQCWNPGRIDAALRFSDAGQLVIGSGRDEVPFGLEGSLGAAYLHIGQPERMVDWCRAQLARGRDTHGFTRACLVGALTFAGRDEEARSAANGLVDAAEATRNPFALAFALYAYGRAFRDADPAGARDAVRRGLLIARGSGNPWTESLLASTVSRLEAEHGDPHAALDHLTLAIRNYHDAGNSAGLRNALAILATLFDRLGRHQPAATIAGFALSPFTAVAIPEINTAITHLRDVLGQATYESLARKGETMTTAEMVAYAYDQIDQARAALNAVSK